MLIRNLLALVLSTQIAAFAQAEDAVIESVHEPVFKGGSSWVFHISSRYQGRDGNTDVQWTLLYPNSQGGWVFARGVPDSRLPPNSVKQITGVTDTSWNGRDDSYNTVNPGVPIMFPTFVGKTWTTEAPSIANRGRSVCNFEARGWTKVTVPAGTFRALKIEKECTTFSVIVKAGNASAPSNQLEEAVKSTVRVTDWYVPEVQNFVREVIDFGRQGDFTNFELTSYKLVK